MNATWFPCLGAVLAAAALRADPADAAVTAAMALSTASNYTWHTAATLNGHATELRGQFADNGYALVTFVGFAAAASPAAGGAAPGGTNAVFLGDNKYVVESGPGWSSPPGSTASEPDEPAASSRGSGGRSGGGMRGMRGGGGGRRGGYGGAGQRGGSRSSDEAAPVAGNPPLPSGINLPHEELAIMAANNTDLAFAEGILSGKLTPSGADLLLSPPGSSQRPPEGATGTFQIWIANGAVTKYEWTVSAKTGMNGSRGPLNETVTVELSKIGATRFVVPDAAKRKLNS